MRTYLRVLLVCHAVLPHRLCGDSMDILADLLKPLLRYDTNLPPQRVESHLFGVWAFPFSVLEVLGIVCITHICVHARVDASSSTPTECLSSIRMRLNLFVGQLGPRPAPSS